MDPTQGNAATSAAPAAGASPPASPPAAPAAVSPPPAPAPAPSSGGNAGFSGANPGFSGAQPAPSGGQPTGQNPGQTGGFDFARSVLGQGGPANATLLPQQQQQPTLPAWQQGLPPEAQQQIARWQAQEAEFQRYRPFVELGYQTWQQRQQQAAQPQPAAGQPAKPKSWFGLPEIDRNLIGMISRDPATGQLVAAPGAPPDAVSRYMAFKNAYEDFQFGFAQDPAKYLGDPMKEIAQQVAQQVVQQHLQGFAGQQQAQQLIQQSLPWMSTVDNLGNRVITPEGKVYVQHVRALEQVNPNAPPQWIHEQAVRNTQLDVYRAREVAARQAQQSQQSGQAFVNNAAAGAAGAGVQGTPAQPSGTLNNGAPQPQAMSLAEMLAKNFASAGINDATFQNAGRAA